MLDVAVLSSLTARETHARLGQPCYEKCTVSAEHVTLMSTPLRRYWIVCASPFAREAMRSFIPFCDAVVILYNSKDFLSSVQARQWQTDFKNDIPIHYDLI